MVLTVSEFTVLSVDQISAPSCGLLARRRLGNGRSLFEATDETIELQLTFVAPYVSSAKLEEDVVSDLDAAIDSGLFLSTLLQNSVAYNLTLFNYAVMNPDFEPSLGSNAYSFSSSYAYFSSSYNYDGAAVDAYSSSSYSYDGGNGDDNDRRLSHGANDEYSYEHDVVQVMFSYVSEDSAFSYGGGLLVMFSYGSEDSAFSYGGGLLQDSPYSYELDALDVTFSYGRDDSSFSYGVGVGYGDQ